MKRLWVWFGLVWFGCIALGPMQASAAKKKEEPPPPPPLNEPSAVKNVPATPEEVKDLLKQRQDPTTKGYNWAQNPQGDILEGTVSKTVPRRDEKNDKNQKFSKIQGSLNQALKHVKSGWSPLFQRAHALPNVVSHL